MAIAFGSVSGTTYASRSSLVVTAPTGITNGDVLLAHILWAGNGTTITAPSGWTQVGSTITAIESGNVFYLNSGIFKKVAASESGNYTWTPSATVATQGKITRYTGANGTVNASSSNVANSPGNTNDDATGITTTVNGCMLVYEGFDWGDNTNNLTPPTGYTERLETNPLIYSADVVQSTAGATGTVTHVCNSSISNPRGAWLVALEPSSGGAVTVNATGSAATSARGSVSVVAKATVSPTGRAGTTALGNESVTLKLNVPVTGRTGTMALGNESVIAKATVSPTGSVGTTAKGSVSVTAGGSVSVPVTGRSLTTARGSVIIPNVQVFPTGRAAAGSVGSVTAGPFTGVIVYLEGYGYDGWGEGDWGAGDFLTGGLVTDTGVVDITGSPTVYPTGKKATTATGTVSIRSAPKVYVTGTAGVTATGAADFSLDCTVFSTGRGMTTALGGGYLIEIPVLVNGNQLNTGTKNVFVIGHAVVNLTGTGASANKGDAYVHAWDRVPDENNSWTPVSRPSGTWTPVTTAPANWTPVNKG